MVRPPGLNTDWSPPCFNCACPARPNESQSLYEDTQRYRTRINQLAASLANWPSNRPATAWPLR